MLGNALNPSSNVAQKMSESLNNEIEIHKKFNHEPNMSTSTSKNVLMGPQLNRRNQKPTQNQSVC